MWAMFTESWPERERIREKDCYLIPQSPSTGSKRSVGYKAGKEKRGPAPLLHRLLCGFESGVVMQQSNTAYPQVSGDVINSQMGRKDYLSIGGVTSKLLTSN